jgi:hypothetical protein
MTAIMRGDYVVTGPDIEPVKFKSAREGRDWCAQNHRAEPGQRDRRLMLRSTSALTLRCTADAVEIDVDDHQPPRGPVHSVRARCATR